MQVTLPQLLESTEKLPFFLVPNSVFRNIVFNGKSPKERTTVMIKRGKKSRTCKLQGIFFLPLWDFALGSISVHEYAAKTGLGGRNWGWGNEPWLHCLPSVVRILPSGKLQVTDVREQNTCGNRCTEYVLMVQCELALGCWIPSIHGGPGEELPKDIPFDSTTLWKKQIE